MRYEIRGGNLPYVVCQLEAGEAMTCESGAMSWMDNEIEMRTEGGGFGKVMGRMFTKEHLFQNTYVARQSGEIAFASKFPGSIVAMTVTPQTPIVIQKGAFLASCGNIDSEVFFQKKIAAGLFGGEGFLMRKYFGEGIVFLEIDGSAQEYYIQAGDQKIVDTGYLAMMDASCSIDVRTVSGMKNVFLGGEGLFHTVLTGPGRIVLQSMPRNVTAMLLSSYMPKS